MSGGECCTHEFSTHRGQRESIRYVGPAVRVKGSRELLGFWELNSGPMQERYLPSESSLPREDY